MLTGSVHSTVAFVLLDIAIIIVVARLFGRAARALRQPAVIGEIIAGIALGPSLLGLIPFPFGDAEDFSHFLFPPDAVGGLKTLANLGLVMFMFIVGLELDVALIRGRERRAGVISLFSIVVPFALGALLAQYLHPLQKLVPIEDDPQHKVPFLAFMLFLGVAMSITAFPVLARILTERRMHKTQLGVLTLAAAAVDDILAWTLLAFVSAVAGASAPNRMGESHGGDGNLTDVARIVGLSALFVVIMFVVVRPLLARMLSWHRTVGKITPDMLAIVIVGVVLSASITEFIGIHAIFGAFLFGAIMPRQGAHEFTHEILERLEQFSVLLLLPIFFVIAGFQVDLTKFSKPALVVQLLLILAVAIGGKFVGAFIGARSQRMPAQQSAAVAVLMNTRGLTEIVILLVGVELAVLNTEMFTMMVVMALVTTVMTEPLLRIIYPEKAVQRDIEAAARAELGSELTHRVLVVVEGTPNTTTERMARLADAALAGRAPAEILLSRFLESDDKAPQLELGAGVLPDLAAMAEAVEELNAFAAQLGTSAPVRGLCRFGSPSGEELIRQVTTSDAEVVIVTENWVRTHPAAFDALDGVVVLVAPAELPAVWLEADGEAALGVSKQAVYLRDDGDSDGAHAVILATRAAAHTGRGLTAIVSGGDGKIRRRLQHAFEPMEETPVRARIIAAGEFTSGTDEIVAVARVVDRVGGSAINLRDAVTETVEALRQRA